MIFAEVTALPFRSLILFSATTTPPHTHTCEQVVAFIYYVQMCKEREGERCGAAWPVLGFLLFCVSCWCGPTAENTGREEPSVSKGKC